jgi:hypothetical protein
MKRLALAAVLMLITLASFSRSAHAQACPATEVVCVTPNPNNNNLAALEASLGMQPGELTKQLQSQIGNLFQATNVGSFLKDFQNAQSFSSKGLGVDYASEATLAEIGATATLSFVSNVDKAYKPSGSYTDPPISGGGANFSLMGGLGLGLIGVDPLMIFGNWFKGSATIGQLDGSYQNWGLHGQFRLFGPSRTPSATKLLVRWGGIAVTSGADYSKLTVSTHKQIKSTITVPSDISGAAGASVSLASDVNGTLVFQLDQTTWSVPLEVTTSLRLLSLVTVYGGLGMDWQLGGGSNLKILMDNATITNNGASLGTVSINATGQAKPSAARLREIVGVQLGFFDFVRLFVQVNTTASSPVLTSVAAGLRLAI